MKILTIVMLLLVLISMAGCSSTVEDSSEITDEQVETEIEASVDESLIGEDDSVEIGEMI